VSNDFEDHLIVQNYNSEPTLPYTAVQMPQRIVWQRRIPPRANVSQKMALRTTEPSGSGHDDADAPSARETQPISLEVPLSADLAQAHSAKPAAPHRQGLSRNAVRSGRQVALGTRHS
jgi:hypothetical protein